MFYARSLLERLREPERPDSRAMTDDRNPLAQSILRNLQRLFNSRQGHAPAQMDYGIPPPSEIALQKEALIEMRSRLKECIEKYEPRLSNVEVRHVVDDEDPFILRYQIRARMTTTDDSSRFAFGTLVRPSGQIEIEP